MLILHAPKEIFEFGRYNITAYYITALRHYGIIAYYGITAFRHLQFTAFNYGDYGMCRNRNYNFDGNYTYSATEISKLTNAQIQNVIDQVKKYISDHQYHVTLKTVPSGNDQIKDEMSTSASVLS